MRGKVLKEALEIINGGRQDQYGSPEDSFSNIARYWTAYLQNEGWAIEITKKDVPILMVLFKIAREHNQHKRDNLRDGAGYIGLAADIMEVEDR